MKKLISILTALSVVLGLFNIAVTAEELFCFTDDFDSYEVMSAPDSAGSFTVGNWTKSGIWRGSGYRGVYMKTQIIEYPADSGNRVMSVAGYGASNQACMNLTADTSTLSGSALFSADGYIPNKKNDAAYGIRAMVSEDEKSFYELYIPKNETTFTFRKVVSGTESFAAQLDMPGIESEVPFGMEIRISGGTIAYAVTYRDEIYSGSYTDSAPFETALGDAKVQLGVMGDSQIYYDNVVYKKYDPYKDGSLPENALYYDESENADIDVSDGNIIIALKNEASLRRFILIGDEDFNGVGIYGANRDDFSDEILLAEEGSAEPFDGGAEIVNRESGDKYKYYKITNAVLDQIHLYREIVQDETITLGAGDTAGFLPRFAGMDGMGEWSIEKDSVAGVTENGLLALGKGVTPASISDGTVTFNINVHVLSELEAAVESGREQEYIQKKKHVVDAVNNAVASSDTEEMKNVLLQKIPEILDIDGESITGLDDDRLTIAAKQLTAYEPFGGETLEIADIEKLIAAVEKSVAVAMLCNETDSDKILEILDKYAPIYGIDTESYYYNLYLSDAAEVLRELYFTDAEQICKTVEATYVMSAFCDAESTEEYRNAVEGCAREIGFNREKYNALTETQKLNLYYELSDRSDEITDIDKLRESIDGYEPEEGTADDFALYDDFDSYEPGENNRQDAEQKIGDNWKISPVYRGSGWMGTYMYTAIINDPKADYNGDRALAVKGYGGSEYACVNLVADRSGISSNSYAKADIYLTDTAATRTGIRTAVSSDERSFYELATANSGTNIVFRKVVVDDEVYSAELPGTAVIGSWMTFSIGIAGNKIIYSAVVNGKKYTGEFIDDAPFVRSGNDGFMQLMRQGDANMAYMDNAQYRDFDIYTESDTVPDSMIYFNTAYGKTPDNGIVSLGRLMKIRKIRLTAEGDVFPQGIKLYLCNERDLSDKVLIAESEQQEGPVWEMYNRSTAEAYRFLYIEGEGVKSAAAFVETNQNTPISMLTGDRAETVALLNYNDESLVWTSDHPEIAQVKDGVLCAYTEGTAVLSVSNEQGDVRSVTVSVKGELSEAERLGKTDEYLAEKMPLINRINNAVRAGNGEEILDVLKGEISALKDFNLAMLDDAKNDDIKRMAERIANGKLFENADGSVDVNVVRRLIYTLSEEAAVASISNRSTGGEVKDMLIKYSSYYGTTLDNKYYVAATEKVCNAMKEKTYKSTEEVKNTFEREYTTAAFLDNIVVLKYRAIIEDNAAAIGYDVNKYNKITDKSLLCDAIARNKSSIKDLDALRNFIDNFSQGSTGGNSGGTSGGSSSSSSSGGGVSMVGGVSGVNNTVQNEKSPYNDVSTEHWAYESIVVLSAKGVISGYEDGVFKPEKTVTRAEFIKMLVGAFGMEHTEELSVFTDVTQNDWYYDSMMIAAENGILKGDNGRCNPESPVTREEMAALVYRSMPSDTRDNGELRATVFSDDSSISDWAFAPVKRLQEKGIINGMNDGSFMPKASVTRAQAAKVIREAMRQ